MPEAVSGTVSTGGFDDALFREIGIAVVVFSRVEGLVKLALGTLTGASPEVSALLTKGLTAGAAIKQALALGNALPETQDRERLLQWLKDANRILASRNDLVHSSWVSVWDGEDWKPVRLIVRVENGQPRTVREVMTVEEVRKLRDEFADVLRRSTPDLDPFLPTRLL